MPDVSIEKVLREVHEELDGRVSCVSDHPDGLRVRFDCRDWRDRERRLELDLLCRGAREWTVTVGPCDWFEVLSEHVLLGEHREPWAELYFSSAPSDSAVVLDALSRAHSAWWGEWRTSRTHLHATSAQLESGNGLLARGPESFIRALQKAAAHFMRVNVLRVPGAGTAEPIVFVRCTKGYVICRSLDLLDCTTRS